MASQGHCRQQLVARSFSQGLGHFPRSDWEIPQASRESLKRLGKREQISNMCDL